MTFVQNNKREIDEFEKKEWRVGEYNRLSKEDGDKPESDSIQNQHEINQNHLEYLRRLGENITSVTVYSDDGYGGGTFNRPRYQDMIRDIEAGIINCVIFKDNSRLGRNYPELGRLMEDYFPQKGIRVISVLNNLDSVRDPRGYCSAIVSFSNIVNDDYIRQLSIKIKSTLAMKQGRGEFIGNYAPFGYQKDPENHHRLVIDPEEADIVRLIFEMYVGGMPVARIAKKMNELHIMTPGEYQVQKGAKSFITHARNYPKTKSWAITTINTILKNEVYIGNMVQGKHKSISYRSKKTVETKEEEWTVVEGTHEAIISDDVFALAHERFARHTRTAPQKEKVHILSGYIICGICGHCMNRVVSNGYVRFRCPTRTRAPEKCQCVSVTEERIHKMILNVLQQQIREMVDAKAVLDCVKNQKWGSISNEYAVAIQKAEREKKRLTEAKFKVYDDYASGLITQDDYIRFAKKYDAEIEEQEASIQNNRKSMSELEKSRRQDDEFVKFFEAYSTIQRLDREIVTELLDRIVYHDPEHMEVYFRFSDMQEKLYDLAVAVAEEVTQTSN